MPLEVDTSGLGETKIIETLRTFAFIEELPVEVLNNTVVRDETKTVSLELALGLTSSNLAPVVMTTESVDVPEDLFRGIDVRAMNVALSEHRPVVEFRATWATALRFEVIEVVPIELSNGTWVRAVAVALIDEVPIELPKSILLVTTTLALSVEVPVEPFSTTLVGAVIFVVLDDVLEFPTSCTRVGAVGAALTDDELEVLSKAICVGAVVSAVLEELPADTLSVIRVLAVTATSVEETLAAVLGAIRAGALKNAEFVDVPTSTFREVWAGAVAKTLEPLTLEELSIGICVGVVTRGLLVEEFPLMLVAGIVADAVTSAFDAADVLKLPLGEILVGAVTNVSNAELPVPLMVINAAAVTWPSMVEVLVDVPSDAHEDAVIGTEEIDEAPSELSTAILVVAVTKTLAVEELVELSGANCAAAVINMSVVNETLTLLSIGVNIATVGVPLLEELLTAESGEICVAAVTETEVSLVACTGSRVTMAGVSPDATIGIGRPGTTYSPNVRAQQLS